MCPTEATLLSGPGSVKPVLVPCSITAEAEMTAWKSIDRTDQHGAERNSPSVPFGTVGERLLAFRSGTGVEPATAKFSTWSSSH